VRQGSGGGALDQITERYLRREEVWEEALYTAKKRDGGGLGEPILGAAQINEGQVWAFLRGAGSDQSRTCEGKKSGKKRCMKEKTSTCPMGERGMRRIITTGTMVIKSLAMRRKMFTCKSGGGVERGKGGGEVLGKGG
jgi:hypothetical protein